MIINDISSSNLNSDNFEKYNKFREKLIKENNEDFKFLTSQQNPHARLSFFQRFRQAFNQNVDVDPGRLLGLTDGIFGMVMTLLIFGMSLLEV